MKRLGFIVLAIIYLAAVGLWARHADLPLQSGAAIEAASYHNVLEGDSNTWVVRLIAK